MQDLLFILITVAFFAIAVGFVRLCERIIGPDAEPTSTTPDPAALEVVDTSPASDSSSVAATVGSAAP